MHRPPSAADLLETARTLLRQSILPQLSGPERYQVLMVANAMAIATRQIAAGDQPLEAARSRLAAIYGEPQASLDALEHRLAKDLRAGLFDAPGPRREAVFAHLWEAARATAAESCPRTLSERR
jgi:hypothetical protein